MDITAAIALVSGALARSREGQEGAIMGGRVAAYAARHGLALDALCQSLFWPADSADRRHRRNVAAIVRRWDASR